MHDSKSKTGSPRARAIVLALFVVSGALLALAATPRTVSAAAVPPWFGPNMKVDALPSYSAFSPSIAVGTDGVAYLAYAGWGGSTTGFDIFFAKSTDGGRTWSGPVRVNDDVGAAAQGDPSLALDLANNIYITWSDTRAGGYDIFFAKSITGGLTFLPNVRVNDAVGAGAFQWEPAIAVHATGFIHVVWTDLRNLFTTGPDIYTANSTDGGLSFNPNLQVNNGATGGEQARPAVAVAPDQSVYVVWDDPRIFGRGRDIYFSKSTDLGGTWSPNVVVNDDATSATQDSPVIAVDGNAIYVAWVDSRNANTGTDIYATRSNNGGATFAASVKVNDEAGAVNQAGPAIALRPGRLALAWADDRTSGSSSRDIYWAASTDGLVWGANQRVNDDALPANFQSGATLAFDTAGNIFAAWVDQRVTSQSVFSATLDVIAPTANVGGDVTVDQGSTVPFDGSASVDNFGIASYSWDFGDGAGATGASGSHLYSTPGAYTLTLTVTDFSGNSAATSATITVEDTVTPQIAALQATIQMLFLAIIALAVAIAVSGFMAWRQMRRSRLPPLRPSRMPQDEPEGALESFAPPSSHHDPLDMAPPPEDP